MAEIPTELKRLLREYIKQLNSEIRVDRVILFGSRACRDNQRDSDIDLAVISDSFTNKRSIEILTFLLSKTRNINADIEPLGFSPADFLAAEKGDVIDHIKDTGIVIFEDNKFVM